ncbi:MAG: hypothetical protein K8S23_08200 [Candidatus Cloacimonetes bacterium]|nr:hypothetical protein [Candidatus Cloacimonadota bacterium]
MLPINTKTVIKVLNLSSDERIYSTFEEHSPLVMLWLKRVTDEDIWDELQQKTVEEDLQNSYKFAYCYYLLASTIEFLNLKTIGEGIIKTTGLDQQSTELLSGSEIQSFKKNLEIQALETILEYTNATGYDRLRELKLGTSKFRKTGIKATVI